MRVIQFAEFSGPKVLRRGRAWAGAGVRSAQSGCGRQPRKWHTARVPSHHALRPPTRRNHDFAGALPVNWIGRAC